MKSKVSLSTLAGLLFLSCVGSGTSTARDWVVHAGTLIDGVGDTPRHQVSIVIHDDTIASVESGFLSPAGAQVIDLSNATVMPGSIEVLPASN